MDLNAYNEYLKQITFYYNFLKNPRLNFVQNNWILNILINKTYLKQLRFFDRNSIHIFFSQYKKYIQN